MLSFSGFRIALLQLNVGMDKTLNISRAVEKIRHAVNVEKAQVVALPECFNSPYGTKYFAEYAEEIPGVTSKALSDVAKELKIHLIGGTIPERELNSNKIFNTCTVWNPDGSLQAIYRKVKHLNVKKHLFLLKITFRCICSISTYLERLLSKNQTRYQEGKVSRLLI